MQAACTLFKEDGSMSELEGLLVPIPCVETAPSASADGIVDSWQASSANGGGTRLENGPDHSPADELRCFYCWPRSRLQEARDFALKDEIGTAGWFLEDQEGDERNAADLVTTGEEASSGKISEPSASGKSQGIGEALAAGITAALVGAILSTAASSAAKAGATDSDGSIDLGSGGESGVDWSNGSRVIGSATSKSAGKQAISLRGAQVYRGEDVATDGALLGGKSTEMKNPGDPGLLDEPSHESDLLHMHGEFFTLEPFEPGGNGQMMDTERSLQVSFVLFILLPNGLESTADVKLSA